MGAVSPAFKKKRQSRNAPFRSIFQVSLNQNNFYAKVAYFEVVCSAALQNLDVIPGASATILEPCAKCQQNGRGAIPDTELANQCS